MLLTKLLVVYRYVTLFAAKLLEEVGLTYCFEPTKNQVLYRVLQSTDLCY
jgi:squalene cyclase